MKTLIKSILLLPLVVYIVACGESGGKKSGAPVAVGGPPGVNADYVNYNGQCVHRTTGQVDYTGALCGGVGANNFQLINGFCYEVLPTANIPVYYCQSGYNPSYTMVNNVCKNVQQAPYTSCQGGGGQYTQPYPNYPTYPTYPYYYPTYPTQQPSNCFYINIGGLSYYQCK